MAARLGLRGESPGGFTLLDGRFGRPYANDSPLVVVAVSMASPKSPKPVTCWAGLFSIVWMVGYAFLMDHIGLRGFEPFWLFLTLIFFSWLGFGLLLAVSGVMRGNSGGRICGVLAVLVFLYFAWQMVSPVFQRSRARGALNLQIQSLKVSAPEP